MFKYLIASGNAMFYFKFEDTRVPIYLNKLEADEEGRFYKVIPLWVNHYGIPLQYWSDEGIGHIVSYLGVSHYVNEPTLQAIRISFARICVVMDVNGVFPDTINMETVFGKEFVVKVKYSCTSKRYNKCNKLGNDEHEYKKRVEETRGNIGNGVVMTNVVELDEGEINTRANGERKTVLPSLEQKG